MKPQREASLVKRINQRLRNRQQMLRKTRGRQMQNDYGEYYLHDFDRNTIVAGHVDPEALARELGLLDTGIAHSDGPEKAADPGDGL
jgi:regulator of extracellular matrix RemA (YlzA/DUF370 family)